MTLGKRPRQVVTEVAKWWDTTKKIYGWLVGVQDNPDVSDDVKEGIGHAMNVNTTIGLIPFMDLTKGGILTFDDNKPTVDKDKLDAYINSDYAKSKYTSQDLENMKLWLTHYNEKSLEKAFQQMHIDADVVENNPNDLPSKYFMKYSEELAEKGESTDTKIEDYNGNDKANVKPLIQRMYKSLDPQNQQKLKPKLFELEQWLNFLVLNNPHASIGIEFDKSTGRLWLESYGKVSYIDIQGDKCEIYSPYSTSPMPFKVDWLVNALKICQLNNLLTMTYAYRSAYNDPDNGPRHVSAVKWDLEYATKSVREAIKDFDIRALKDRTWLNDDMFGNGFENSFPELEKNKELYCKRMNGLKSENGSIRSDKIRTDERPKIDAKIKEIKEKYHIVWEIEDVFDDSRSWLVKNKFTHAVLNVQNQTPSEVMECLTMIENTLSLYPQGILKKYPIQNIYFGRKLSQAGERWSTGVLYNEYGSVQREMITIDTDNIEEMKKWWFTPQEALFHELIHHFDLTMSNNNEKQKWEELNSQANFYWAHDYVPVTGALNGYSRKSVDEDIATIWQALFNKGRVNNLLYSDVSWDLFERMKTDQDLLSKVEVFTWCEVDPNNPDKPFTKKLTDDQRKAYGFEWPAFFSKRCSDAGTTIDHNYWNNLKQKPIT